LLLDCGGGVRAAAPNALPRGGRMNGAIRNLKPAMGFVGLWLLLLAIWIGANSTCAIESILVGALISGVLAFAFTRGASVWRDFRFTPQRLYHFLRYTVTFLVELVRANINMLRHVYSPRIDIDPGVVEIKTGLKSPIGRLALANSIALTPGSLVVDMKDDTISVHCLVVETEDQDEATRRIAGPFEKHLEKVFG
jgi:multicomponent Na+:H+ antiporter subunit E